MIQDLLNAMTPLEYLSAIQDANSTDEADKSPQLVVVKYLSTICEQRTQEVKVYLRSLRQIIR